MIFSSSKFWVDRKARYPYVSRETWITRYWLLRRKIAAQNGFSTDSDRRVAETLLALRPPSRAAAPQHLIDDLVKVVLNGPEPYPYFHSEPTEEDLGS